MDNQKLNLLDYISVGDTVFSLVAGETTITNFDDDDMPICVNGDYYRADGSEDGVCLLYPSRESFIKHGANARAAWEEWAKANTVKRAAPGGWYYVVQSDGNIACDADGNSRLDKSRYDYGNYFLTREDAERAAELIKTTLRQFHKDNNKK